MCDDVSWATRSQSNSTSTWFSFTESPGATLTDFNVPSIGVVTGGFHLHCFQHDHEIVRPATVARCNNRHTDDDSRQWAAAQVGFVDYRDSGKTPVWAACATRSIEWWWSPAPDGCPGSAGDQSSSATSTSTSYTCPSIDVAVSLAVPVLHLLRDSRSQSESASPLRDVMRSLHRHTSLPCPTG
jgi:hypothetical protein